MEKAADIERLLSEGKVIQIRPKGWSMYPMMRSGRDEAVIAPVGEERLKRGDVVLYRREGSILVLHRIWKATDRGFFLVGDNQVEIEGPVKPEQVKGRLSAFIREGRTISVRHPLYRLYASVWLCLRPMRNGIKRPVAWIKKRLVKNK